MGLFSFFGSKNDELITQDEKQIEWKRLTHLDQLKEIIDESYNLPIGIFKHSTRCGISRMVLRQFERSFDIAAESITMYYLDLLNFREVSDKVAYTFQIVHQSPQLIVIHKGSAVAHASHQGIQVTLLEKFVGKIT